MKKLLFITLLAVSASSMYCQNLAHSWSKSLSGASDIVTVVTRIDPNGDVVSAGMFSGTIDLDASAATATFTSNGLRDVFIVKYSASGNFIYANTFGGSGNDEVKDMLFDGYQFYLVGNFEGTVNFGTGNKTSNGLRDVFINKYTIGGTSFPIVWSQTFGGNGDDVGNAIVKSVVVLTDAIWVTGGFSNTVDFNPGTGTDNKNSFGLTDIYVTRFDLNGNYIAVTTHGSTSYDMGNDITGTNADVYVTGHFTGTVDFGYSGSPLNLVSAGSQDAFVSKYATANGLTTWAKAMGGSSSDNGISIGIDNSLNIYSTGTFQGTADFDPSAGIANLTSAGGTDVYISKLLNAGTYSWARKMGGTLSDAPNDIFVEGIGHHFVTGSFIGTANFLPSATNTIIATGAKDIFVTKYNSGGGFLYSNTIGGSGDEEPRSLFVANTNHVYLSGYFKNTVDFDMSANTSTLTATGTSADGFVAKYFPCAAFALTASSTGTLCAGQSFSLNATAGLTSYAWSGPNSFTASIQTPTVTNSTPLMSGTYTLTGVDVNGCSASRTTTVSVITNTNVVASVVPQTICEGNNFVLNASGGNTYLWNGPNSYTSAVQSPTISNSALAMSGIYSVTATPTGGCAGTSTVNITVNSLPTPSITNLGPFCAGSTATLNASGASTYIWTAPASAGSFTSSAQNFTFTALNGFYAGTYYLAGISVAGCVNTTTTNVIVISAPNATASNAGPYCVGNTIALSATGGGSYAWSGPLSYTSSLQNPTISNVNVTQAGIYTVTTTFSGCAKTATTNVVVNSNTAVVASVSSNTICEGSNFTLNANGGVTYAWTGPNTFTSTNQNPNFTNATTALSGIYTLTAVNSASCSGTATLNVNVNQNPLITASSTSGTICSGGNVQLNAAGANTYLWQGPNFYVSINQNPLINSVNQSFTGTYSVTGTNAVGCSSTATTSVFVSSVFLNNTVNTNGNVLTASEAGATSYQWIDCSNNNIPIAGATSQSFTATASGNYAVIITKNTCSIISNCTQVTVNNCTFNINVTQTGNTLSAIQTGVTYQWVDCNNSNAVIVGATTQAFTPTVTGNYAATITSGTCVATSACAQINIMPVGVSELNVLNAITLQPNPASTYFTLSNVVEGTSVNVIDVTGKVIASTHFDKLSGVSLATVINSVDKTMMIETSNLSNGIYVIQLKNNGAVAHKKLIVSK
ncbi:MAG TPA: T9SS type A sorting domain-containing protein [Bacteroidia bacterium]|nr:T9SS type A sorting domain-containing protein [Bacteroidia bacterium]